MNSLVVIFGALVGLVCCCSAMSPAKEECKEEGPGVYCMSDLRMEQCQAQFFCILYFHKTICPKGPEVYCKLERTAYQCDKEEFCSAWLKERAPTTKKPEESLWEQIQRIYGNSMISFRSRPGGY